MNVAELLLSRGSAGAPALIEGARITSYAELRSGVGSVAAWIGRQTLEPGSRIGILAENGAFFVKAYLGIIHAGMVAVPLNIDGSTESAVQVLHAAGASALLASRRQALRLTRSAPAVPCAVASENTLRDTSESPPAVAVHPATDLAALMFTSGSTGNRRVSRSRTATSNATRRTSWATSGCRS